MSYDISLLLDGLILVFLCVTIFYAARLSLFMKSFREGRSEMQRLVQDLSVTIDKAEASVANMKDHAGSTEVELKEIINKAKFLSEELRFMNETGDGLANRLEKLADRNRELVDLMERSGGIGTQKITPYDPGKTEVPSQSEETHFDIDDFDLDQSLDDDDEFDFMALSDGAYREEEAYSDHALSDSLSDEGDDVEEFYKPKIDTAAKSKVRSFAIFDREFEGHHEDDVLNDDDEVFEPAGTEKKFHSRAEQDLYEALQRKKRDYDKNKASDVGAHKTVSKLS